MNAGRREAPVTAAVVVALAFSACLALAEPPWGWWPTGSRAWAPAVARAAALSVRGEAGLAASVTSGPLHPISLDARIEASGEWPALSVDDDRNGDPRIGAGLPGTLAWRITANPTLRLQAVEPVPPARPGWQVDAQPLDWALEEAYVAWRQGGWIVSAGRERLPLEVARLSLPYSIEPVTEGGLRVGLWGVRLTRSAGPTRLRVAAVEDPRHEGHVMPVASLRWQVGAIDLEGHTLLPADVDQITAGVTASGLVGDVVAYGELWQGSGWRYVGGLSGFSGDTLWTIEAGRAQVASDPRARRLVGAQFAWQQDAEVAWTVAPYAFFDEDGLRVQVNVDRAFATGSHEWRLFASATLGPESPTWMAGAAYRHYWGL